MGSEPSNEFLQRYRLWISAGISFQKLGTWKYKYIKLEDWISFTNHWRKIQNYAIWTLLIYKYILFLLNFKGDHITFWSNAIGNNVGLHAAHLIVVCFHILLVLGPGDQREILQLFSLNMRQGIITNHPCKLLISSTLSSIILVANKNTLLTMLIAQSKV